MIIIIIVIMAINLSIDVIMLSICIISIIILIVIRSISINDDGSDSKAFSCSRCPEYASTMRPQAVLQSTLPTAPRAAVQAVTVLQSTLRT